MRLPKNKSAYAGLSCLFFSALVIAATACPRVGIAENSLPDGKELENKTLHITADRLVADQNALYILFTGNVEADYGEMKISSDGLKLLYTKAVNGETHLNKDAIDEIIASGDVVITFEDKTAECEKAVYNPKSETIILSGENTRVVSGNNYITGQTITIHQDTGQITVDGKTGDRVNAVFNPEDGEREPF